MTDPWPTAAKSTGEILPTWENRAACRWNNRLPELDFRRSDSPAHARRNSSRCPFDRAVPSLERPSRLGGTGNIGTAGLARLIAFLNCLLQIESDNPFMSRRETVIEGLLAEDARTL